MPEGKVVSLNGDVVLLIMGAAKAAAGWSSNESMARKKRSRMELDLSRSP
jgi:hypothetical protein